MYKGDRNKFGEAQLAEMEKRKSRSYIKTPDEVLDNLHVGDRLEGSILYNTYCASCHQQDGKGDNNRFPPLVDSEWVKGDEARLINIVLNGYQGEIKVILLNTDPWKEKYIKKNDRIAQIVFQKIEKAEFLLSESFNNESNRSDNGFGSTGN